MSGSYMIIIIIIVIIICHELGLDGPVSASSRNSLLKDVPSFRSFGL